MKRDKKEKIQKLDVKSSPNRKGELQRITFLKYFLSEKIDGKKNPCFGKVGKSAQAAGYSKSYGQSMLARLAEQQNEQSQSYENLRKSLVDAIKSSEINGEKLVGVLMRLLDKNEKRVINKKLVDTKDPDPTASRVALDFIGKTQKLYEGDNDDRDRRTKDEIIASILGRLEQVR